jgi:hypothetical protein
MRKLLEMERSGINGVFIAYVFKEASFPVSCLLKELEVMFYLKVGSVLVSYPV